MIAPLVALLIAPQQNAPDLPPFPDLREATVFNGNWTTARPQMVGRIFRNGQRPELVLDNGLIRRVIDLSLGARTTQFYRHGERPIPMDAPEARLELDGQTITLAGEGSEFRLIRVSMQVPKPDPEFRVGGDPQAVLTISGTTLILRFASADRPGLLVDVTYFLPDRMPVLQKRVTLINGPGAPVRVGEVVIDPAPLIKAQGLRDDDLQAAPAFREFSAAAPVIRPEVVLGPGDTYASPRWTWFLDAPGATASGPAIALRRLAPWVRPAGQSRPFVLGDDVKTWASAWPAASAGAPRVALLKDPGNEWPDPAVIAAAPGRYREAMAALRQAGFLVAVPWNLSLPANHPDGRVPSGEDRSVLCLGSAAGRDLTRSWARAVGVLRPDSVVLTGGLPLGPCAARHGHQGEADALSSQFESLRQLIATGGRAGTLVQAEVGNPILGLLVADRPVGD